MVISMLDMSVIKKDYGKEEGRGGEAIIRRSKRNPSKVLRTYENTIENPKPKINYSTHELDLYDFSHYFNTEIGPYANRTREERADAVERNSRVPGLSPKAKKIGKKVLEVEYRDFSKAVNLEQAIKESIKGNDNHLDNIAGKMYDLNMKENHYIGDVTDENAKDPNTFEGDFTADTSFSGPLTRPEDVLIDVRGALVAGYKTVGKKGVETVGKAISRKYGKEMIEGFRTGEAIERIKEVEKLRRAA